MTMVYGYAALGRYGSGGVVAAITHMLVLLLTSEKAFIQR